MIPGIYREAYIIYYPGESLESYKNLLTVSSTNLEKKKALKFDFHLNLLKSYYRASSLMNWLIRILAISSPASGGTSW